MEPTKRRVKRPARAEAHLVLAASCAVCQHVTPGPGDHPLTVPVAAAGLACWNCGAVLVMDMALLGALELLLRTHQEPGRRRWERT